MLTGLYISTAGGMVQSARQDVVANNLANINTPGFKRHFAIVRERLNESAEQDLHFYQTNEILEKIGGGVFLHETPHLDQPGPLEQTDQKLDLALKDLDGRNFFAVTDGRETFYTRAGNFKLNADGEVVSSDGRYKLLLKNGRPLVVGAATDVKISGDARVEVDGRVVGELDLRQAPGPRALRRYGYNVYASNLPGGLPASTGVPAVQVAQGYLEKSNVNAVTEMVSMIDTLRAYEANMKLVTEQDANLAQIVGRVPQIG